MGKKSRRIKPTAKIPAVIRAFNGIDQEGDLIALREFVTSATATTTLKSGRTLRLVTMLPGNGVGLVRPDGEIWVALQVPHNNGDVSRDLAHVIELAETLEPGTVVKMTTPVPGARLQDLIAEGGQFLIENHADFNWWLTPEEADSADALAAMRTVNDNLWQSERLATVESAWVTDMGDHVFLRWVMPWADEDRLLDAFSRLKAEGQDKIIDGTKLIGMFRAHGVLVPVWELEGVSARDVAAATPAFQESLQSALAIAEPLTSAQRSVRQELISRQVTIR